MSVVAAAAGGLVKAAVAVPVATVAAVALKGVIVAGGVACGILLIGGAIKMVREREGEECLEAGAGLLTALRGAARSS
jgi:hypothetical protein